MQRAIRDQRWKLIQYPQINVTQLFDLQNDPHELNNLAANPQFAGKVKELFARLGEAQKEYGDDSALTSAHPKPAAWTPPVKSSAGRKSHEPNQP